MYTIYDYLKYYKDKKLDQLNDIDFLLFSILAYLPIKNYDGKKSFKEFYEYSLLFNNNLKKHGIAKKAYELLDIIKDGTRYSEVDIYNPLNIKNNDTQFFAMKFKINDDTVISYRGTDGSYIGWIENFRLSYKFPTYTQELALKYLNDNTNIFDKNIYLVGHSKGGNLAISALYQSNALITNKIKKVYNFDGPGLRYKEYTSNRFKIVQNKIINYIPTGSIVGVLLDNKEYNVIKSTEFAYKEHYPTSWQVFGEFFIKGELSKASNSIHNASTNNIRDFKYNQMEDAFEKLYTTLGKEYNSDFKLSYNDLKNLYLNMKTIDPDISKYLESLINSIIKLKNNNK